MKGKRYSETELYDMTQARRDRILKHRWAQRRYRERRVKILSKLLDEYRELLAREEAITLRSYGIEVS